MKKNLKVIDMILAPSDRKIDYLNCLRGGNSLLASSTQHLPPHPVPPAAKWQAAIATLIPSRALQESGWWLRRFQRRRVCPVPPVSLADMAALWNPSTWMKSYQVHCADCPQHTDLHTFRLLALHHSYWVMSRFFRSLRIKSFLDQDMPMKKLFKHVPNIFTCHSTGPALHQVSVLLISSRNIWTRFFN